jgi:hypothetical protein
MLRHLCTEGRGWGWGAGSTNRVRDCCCVSGGSSILCCKHFLLLLVVSMAHDVVDITCVSRGRESNPFKDRQCWGGGGGGGESTLAHLDDDGVA